MTMEKEEEKREISKGEKVPESCAPLLSYCVLCKGRCSMWHRPGQNMDTGSEAISRVYLRWPFGG